jgi:hypothetical protein
MIVPVRADLLLAAAVLIAVPALALAQRWRDGRQPRRDNRWPPGRQVATGVALIGGTVLARLAGGWPNVAPVAAVALLAGSFFSWPWAAVVPLTAMMISDAFLGFASLPIVASVYGSFFLTVVIGRQVAGRRSAGRIVLSSLLSSLLFYLITNAAVWKFGWLYPPTLGGLLQSYYFGLPFLRMTVLGDLAYTTALFLAAACVPVALRRGVHLCTMVWRKHAWYQGYRINS